MTGMALAHCILGKFLGVVCHCFPPYRIYQLIKEEEISQFQDVWIQKILITALCYNNFNNSNITLYIDIVIADWHYIYYHLQLTKLYDNTVYILKY